jgi:protein SCO1/2
MLFSTKRKFGKKSRYRRLLHFLAAALLGVILALGFFVWQAQGHQGVKYDSAGLPVFPPDAKIGGPFTLTDQDGKAVTEKTYAGKYLLVYFGYTSCPDMCPTGLQSISRALDSLKEDSDKVQPLFITIDPMRDTPQRLKEYDAAFHPKIVGLTGTKQEIAAVAKEYEVYYKKGEGDEDYVMDHSSIIYLMSPGGKLLGVFTEEVDPALLVDALKKAWNAKS